MTAEKTRMIQRQSLHDMIVGRLREMIEDGTLVPGQKIPEQALAAQLGVSRTPLREGLKALSSEGLVTLRPNRGAIVAILSEREIAELFPIISTLEALAGGLACAAASDEEISEFRHLHDAMCAQHAARDEMAYQRTNRAFHSRLIALAGNAALAGLYDQIHRRIHSARFILSKGLEDWDRAVADHERIVRALEARDTAGLERLLRDHLSDTAANAMRRALRRAPAPESAAEPGRPGAASSLRRPSACQ